ncbi:MAG: glycosyltransferase [Patescibacteria group bacterium]
MKVTVVIPLLNEVLSLDALLHALMKQTLSPTEVILVDGGSKDGSIEKIQEWQQKKLSFNLVLLEKLGANRSVARNFGIKEARTEVIALTDAGCKPKADWLEKLTTPFIDEERTEVVAGFYDPAPQNWWEDVLADYTCTRDWNFQPNTFLPSSRSLAITKTIWHKVGGYPEHLNTCEDLIFAEKLKNKSKHWQVVKEAQVIWNQPHNLSELSQKIFGYATGDLQAKYERHVNKIYSAMWRIIVLICVAVPAAFIGQPIIRVFGLSFFALYIVGSLGKHPRMLKYPLAIFAIPVIQLTVDASLVQALIYHKLSSQYK